MPRKRPAPSERPSKAPPSRELGARVAELGTIVEHIELQLSRLDELASELVRAHERVTASSVRADNALDACKMLTQRVDALTIAVAHGIEHVDRAENRIKATVSRARRELAEHGLSSPGIEAEAQQLHLIDASTGESREVPTVRTPVDADPPPDQEDPLLSSLRALRLSK